MVAFHDRKNDEFMWRVFDRFADSSSLADLLRPKRPSGLQITADTVISKYHEPVATIKAILPPRLRDQEIRGSAWIAAIRIEDRTRSAFAVAAVATAYPGIFHLVATIPTTDPRWKRFERWVSGAEPEVVACFLNHKDFADIGTAIAEFGDVEVSRITARRLADLSSLNRGWKSRPKVTRPTHHEALSAAEEEGASVRTITLSVSDRISLHLRRIAGATYYHGDFELFESAVLTRLALAASRRLHLMTNRERQVAAKPAPPILVDLGQDLFLGADDTAQLLDELQTYRDISVAVLHRNPYLHVVVTDYTDGSNFDLFVTNPAQVEIHPGFKASPGSLTRLTQSIGQSFEAKRITEKPPAERLALSDLVSE